jgi:hypothetical protein
LFNFRNDRKARLEALVNKSLAEGFGFDQMKPDIQIKPIIKVKNTH